VRAWFERLSRRDQLLLVPLGLASVAILLYLGVWSPVTEALARRQEANANAVAALDWMREAAREIKERRSGWQGGSSGESLSAMVDASLPQHELVMQRFQPVGDRAAQVWLEEAPVPQVIAWLAAVERGGGARVDNVSIVAADNAGQVKTRVRISKP